MGPLLKKPSPTQRGHHTTRLLKVLLVWLDALCFLLLRLWRPKGAAPVIASTHHREQGDSYGHAKTFCVNVTWLAIYIHNITYMNAYWYIRIIRYLRTYLHTNTILHCMTWHRIVFHDATLHCITLHCIGFRDTTVHCAACRYTHLYAAWQYCLTWHCLALRLIAWHDISLPAITQHRMTLHNIAWHHTLRIA